MSMRSLLGGAAPRALRASAPVPYVGRSRGNLLDMLNRGRRHGTTDELEQYGEIGTLFGVVSKLASTTSLVNWRLYQSSASGLKADRVEIVNSAKRQNPVIKLLKRPNEFMPWQEFCETFQQHIDLTGKAWWVIVKAMGIPVEMWPVRPDRMYAIPSVKDFIAGYVYCSPDGEEIPLAREDVIMLRWPAPLDIYDGQSPLPALSGDIANEQAQREWSESFFENSATPGGIIKTGVRLSEPEFDELVDRWNRSHRGVGNAGRVAVLEQGDFVPLAYTQKDMQFVESRNFTKQAILDSYGFPKFGLGDVADVNRASADASKAYMAESLSVPRLERIKAAINYELIPMFGLTGQEIDYDNPTPDDQEVQNQTLTAKVSAVVALVNAGFDEVEACNAVGLPVMSYDATRRVQPARQVPTNA
jgi:HK97 family phage portal protein